MEREQHPEHTTNWESGEFGPLGYRFPLIAKLYAAFRAVRTAHDQRGDDALDLFDIDIPTMTDDIDPAHIDSAVRVFGRSTRRSDRELAGELLGVKQQRLLSQLSMAARADVIDRDAVPEIDPEYEVSLWVELIDGEPEPEVLNFHYESLPVGDVADQPPTFPKVELTDIGTRLRKLHDHIVSLQEAVR